MASRVRKRIFFCETNSTPQRPIEPHEICVKPPRGQLPAQILLRARHLHNLATRLKITCDYDDCLLRIS